MHETQAQEPSPNKKPDFKKNIFTLAFFILLVVGGGITIGITTVPGPWYANLQKPFFNPPNWIFGPVWTALYLMIAFVGWRTWQCRDSATLKRVWAVQLFLNFFWSPVFFWAQMPGLAFCIIVCLMLVVLVFIRTAWRQDHLSAQLFVPYAAWLGFASLLNLAIFYLNMAS